MIDTHQQASTTTTFGAKLQSARESQNITRNEVAARLRLNPDIIRALETDDFQSTPHAIFTRGYIRAYARLLHFNDSEIEAALSASGLTIINNDFIAPALQKKENLSADRYMPIFSGVVIFLLFGLVVAWWKIHTKSELVISIPVAQQSAPVATPASPPPQEAALPTTAASSVAAVTNTPPAMVPVVLPEQKPSVVVADKQPAKNPRQKPPFTDMINSFSEPGLEEPSE